MSFVLAGLLILSAGCGDSPAAPNGFPADPDDRVVEGVNLTELFAPATDEEQAAVEAEWEEREVSADGYTLELTESVSIGAVSATLQVVSHLVDGHRHFGAVIVPTGASPGEVPVLVYAHGGDGGVSLEEVLLIAAAIDVSGAPFIYVAPAFRGEPLAIGGQVFMSEGEPSPWDRDVDDALALLETVLATVPAADPERVGVLGVSRGGGVALLMAIRDPRIDVVVEFFGPTDFFGEFVEDVVEEALLGTPRNLPGLTHLDGTVIQPLREGELAMEEARLELVRRSAVLWAEELPPLQAHHGDADDVVHVSQALALRQALADAGLGPPDHEVFTYGGAGHNPFEMPTALARTRSFLGRIQ